MANISIDLEDGPRGGDTIRINNMWEYPEHLVVPYKDVSGVMHMIKYSRELVDRDVLRKKSASYVYKYQPDEA
jgi:hypothetical protein